MCSDSDASVGNNRQKRLSTGSNCMEVTHRFAYVVGVPGMSKAFTQRMGIYEGRCGLKASESRKHS